MIGTVTSLAPHLLLPFRRVGVFAPPPLDHYPWGLDGMAYDTLVSSVLPLHGTVRMVFGVVIVLFRGIPSYQWQEVEELAVFSFSREEFLWSGIGHGQPPAMGDVTRVIGRYGFFP